MKMRSTCPKAAFEIRNRLEVHGTIFPNRGVRTTAGLNAPDALGWQSAGANQELGIFPSVDIVGNRADTKLAAEPAAKPVDERRLAASHRTGDSDAKSALRMRVRHRSQNRKYLWARVTRLEVRK